VCLFVNLISYIRFGCSWKHKAVVGVFLPVACIRAEKMLLAPSPKKYATNCLNSPTKISYSVYFVCRCPLPLPLSATLSAQRFSCPENFSHVLKLKLFFSAFSLACVSSQCFYLLSSAGQQSAIPCHFSLYISHSLPFSMSLLPYLIFLFPVWLSKFVLFSPVSSSFLSQLFSQGQFVNGSVC